MSQEAEPLTESEVSNLLKRLCVDLGCCLWPDVRAQLETSPPDTVEEFTRAVFIGEGLISALADRDLYRKVQADVTAAFERAPPNDEAKP